jgi:hypothetical protein
MKNGFVTLVGLLIVILLIGILFVKIYATKDSTNQKTQIETYKEDIQKAEDAKKLLEGKTFEY